MVDEIFDENVPEKLIGQRDWYKTKNELQKEKYRESLQKAEESTLQQGFDLGYKVASDQAFNIGRLRGEISALLTFSQDEQSTKFHQLTELLEEVKAYEESLLKPVVEDIEDLVPINMNKSKIVLAHKRNIEVDQHKEFTDSVDFVDKQLREEILDGFGLSSEDVCEKHKMLNEACSFVGDMTSDKDKNYETSSIETFSNQTVKDYYRSDYSTKLKYLEDKFKSIHSRPTS